MVIPPIRNLPKAFNTDRCHSDLMEKKSGRNLKLESYRSGPGRDFGLIFGADRTVRNGLHLYGNGTDSRKSGVMAKTPNEVEIAKVVATSPLH
ncbi:hypothetical protein VNO77_44545 [Canavalia gladiata]|uniref:Uncharacterized protein n=1 Tax=Canavalia gladiata TaxID=3824 RepID=A0AAN9JY95_CANGL